MDGVDSIVLSAGKRALVKKEPFSSKKFVLSVFRFKKEEGKR